MTIGFGKVVGWGVTGTFDKRIVGGLLKPIQECYGETWK